MALLFRLQLRRTSLRPTKPCLLTLPFFRNLHNKKEEFAHKIETSLDKAQSTSALTFAERCKNVLAANWQGILTTVKANATGGKDELHSSSVHYIFLNKEPVIWVQEDDLHTVNIVLDERGAFCIDQTNPSPLVNFLKTVGKLPPRVVLVGDVIHLEEDEINDAKRELQDMIISEKKIIDQASCPVTSILISSGEWLNARIKDLEMLLEKSDSSTAFKFSIRSCTYANILGDKHEINLQDIEKAPLDPLSPFFAPLIEGINQSEARRRGLMLFCSVYLNVNARDSLMLSVDRKGFDVLVKVSCEPKKDLSSSQYRWKDMSFSFGKEVEDIETFCHLLTEMEKAALKRVSGMII